MDAGLSINTLLKQLIITFSFFLSNNANVTFLSSLPGRFLWSLPRSRRTRRTRSDPSARRSSGSVCVRTAQCPSTTPTASCTSFETLTERGSRLVTDQDGPIPDLPGFDAWGFTPALARSTHTDVHRPSTNGTVLGGGAHIHWDWLCVCSGSGLLRPLSLGLRCACV